MSLPKICVLIVDDDIVDRLACRRAIAGNAHFEFELIEAATGQDGLRQAAIHTPDCILLDYHLPDLNGLEFLAELAGEAAEMPIPVILLTGADSAEIAAAAIKRGAWDYLGKDIDGKYLEKLPSLIQRMLRERQLSNDKRQAEAKFRSLVEQIDAITYIAPLDAVSGLLYISPQIAMLGFSSEEWLADPTRHARQMHPDDRLAATRAIDQSRTAGSALRLEYRLLTRGGEVLWFRDEAKAVTDEAGNKLFVQGILVDITGSKLAEQALRQSQSELRQLTGHLEHIKEAERKRIAQEIHDELGGMLTGIKAYVSVYVERAVRAGAQPDPLLVDAIALADSGFKAVRRVITELRPSVLDQLGVWAALEWYADQVAKRSGLECTCTIDASAAAIELNPDLSTMLFRIVQEALTNTVRHAEASGVVIHAMMQDDNIVVEVKDNGKGIRMDAQVKQDSWGLVGMHERARYFGGTLTVESKDGEGSSVKVCLPIGGVNGN
jgi:two-component system sensor histidine kinase UhpB